MNGRIAFLLRRLGHSVLMIVGIAVLTFFVLHLIPGDLADYMAAQGGGGDAAYVADLRARFGLDQPLWLQLFTFLSSLIRLDLGYSFRDNLPVIDVIKTRLPATLLLMSVSIAFAFIAGALLGAISAMRVHKVTDAVISFLAVLGYATPLFWLGLLMIYLFTVKLGWLPSSGMRTIGRPAAGWDAVADVARHVLMPALTLALFYMAVFVRLMRASMLEIATLDFVRTARAKGMSEFRVYFGHIIANAMLPMVTMLGVQISTILGGSVVVETVFGWPGLGRLTYDALVARDVNLLLGILFLSSVLVIATNLLIDCLYSVLDPRIEVAG
jgi:peptide/nickel transport system permease protein